MKRRQHNVQDLLTYYNRGAERERLDDPKGLIEFERTKEVILRRLPPPPARIADVGGGPGRYTLWLASLGYRVHHRDLVALHVEQLQEALAGESGSRIDTAVGDACHLDLADQSADAVLLMGPLYHLPQRPDRLQALREAKRILKPGGALFVTAISRWSPRLDAVVGLKIYETFPEVLDDVGRVERSGWFPPLIPGGFTGYGHRPQQLRAEIRGAGLAVVSLVGLEMVTFLLHDLSDRVRNPHALRVLLESARALEAVPELLGLSPHLLATAVRPD